MKTKSECEDHIDCEKIREMVFLYYDNELDRATMLSFYRHAERCPECWRRVGYTTRLLTSVTLRLRRNSAPNALRDRILSVLER